MSWKQRGWVLWRDEPGVPPRWVLGTLRTGGGAVSLEREDGTDPAEVHAWITPGFVDLHSHLAIEVDGIADADAIKKNALEEIRAGVLAIRQPGTPVEVPTDLLPYGRPIVVDAGKHIALERRYIRGLSNEIPADDSDRIGELLRLEVREQADEGTGWIKLVGDWIDRSAGEASDLRPLWTGDQLRGAVEEAHARGARVAVHTFSRAAIDDLLDAGVDSIEHGSGMTPEQMQRAAGLGIPVVPTTSQVLKFPEFAEGAKGKYPVYANTMQQMFDQRLEWFDNLLESGVQILPGSDAGGYQPHGSIIDEAQRWVQWGMSASRAFAALTWESRDFLGLHSLSEGAPADILVFDEDPTQNPQTWAAPIQIVANGTPLA